MTLAPLADVADLPTAWQTHDDADRALEVASAAIRDAAGVAIGELEATIVVPAPAGTLLTLPGPITAVETVLIDDIAVTDYRMVGNGLWRRYGWACEPVPVTITYTFGLGEVPADIVGMCADLAAAWLQHRDSGGAATPGVTSARIDDTAETYSDESAGQVSPVFIPEVTRNWLAARFGGGAAVVETL